MHDATNIRRRPHLALIAVLVVAAACSSSPRRAQPSTAASSSSASSSVTSSPPATSGGSSTTAAAFRAPCGNPGAAPARYSSVVVFAFENRTWSDVGMGFSHMPYLHGLARRCAYFTNWTETDTGQSSLTQYVGQVTGARQSRTVNDCPPSAICSTTADNIFRQARRAGIRAVNYVEGATSPCSAAGNAAKHVPALYMWGANDPEHCDEQVRPYRELDVDHLPAFAFVTPTLCHDGHDCGNDVVDGWARDNVQRVLDSAAYRAGRVAVFIWYDEDHPVPNLWIAPNALSGAHDVAGAGFAGTLAAWESMLGLPCLADACAAPDMRRAAGA